MSDDLSTFQRKLAERRAREATKPVSAPAFAFDPDLIPEVETPTISPAQQRVNELWDANDILAVYDQVIRKQREQPGKRTEGIKCSCPSPTHLDKHPSAWFNLDKQVITCGTCGFEGWNKAGLVATAFGIENSPANFAVLKREYAKRVHGFDYEAETAAPMPPAPGPAPGPLAPVAGPSSTPEPTAGRTTPPAPTGTPDAATTAWEAEVSKATSRELVNREARRRASQIESEGLFSPPAFVNFADELTEDDPEIEWTVEGLHAVGTNSTITAGFKTGKSTLMRNLVAALIDGRPFLGRHSVRALAGRVAYLNFEVEQVQMKRDLRDMGLINTQKLFMAHLRGHHLDVMDDTAYRWLVEQLRGAECEVLILDPYSGAYYGDENDNSQVNAFTKRLDELKRDAGVVDLFMPAHTGRSVEEAERARGAAKLDDWADSRWVLTRDRDTDRRYLRAEGRRVEHAEAQLAFDRATNALTYSGTGSRKEAVRASTGELVLEYVRLKPGCTTNDITGALTGTATIVRQAIKKLISDGEIETRPRNGGGFHHYLMGTAP